MSEVVANEGLSSEDAEFFHQQGYLVLPGFIEPDYNARLIAEVDELIAHREAQGHRLLVSYKKMGLLTSYPPLMHKLDVLMGGRYSMHHIHSARHDAGNGGVHWHQDYEQYPQTNRSHLMVHVFYYLNGLTGEIGDLLILPKSQDMIVGNGGLQLFATEDLPGSLCVDELTPGSAIIVHSGVWHARRPKPGGEDRPRYFIDVSYCQHGVLWPAYGNRMDEINAMAIETGLGRNGQYDYVYDTSHFFEREPIREQFEKANEGSLALKLKDVE